MTIRRNQEKRKRLLAYWRVGRTVVETGQLTMIPPSTVGYYFKGFNKDPEKYMKVVEGKFQDPFKIDVRRAAIIGIDWMERKAVVDLLIRDGKYVEARDYLQMVLLYNEFNEKYLSKISNVDHIELNSAIISIYKEINLFRSIVDDLKKRDTQLYWEKLKKTTEAIMESPEYNESDQKRRREFFKKIDEIMAIRIPDSAKEYSDSADKKFGELIDMINQNTSIPQNKRAKKNT